MELRARFAAIRMYARRSRLRTALGIFAILVLTGTVAFAEFTMFNAPYVQGGVIDYKAAKTFWAERIPLAGIDEAHLEFIRKSRPLNTRESHLFSHAFGEALFETAGLDGLTACEGLNYGCYHQFVGAAVAEAGTDVSGTLYDICRSKNINPDGCVHGVGHGFVGFFGYSLDGLRRSLAICDRIEAGAPSRPCINGAMMEYNQRQLGTLSPSEESARPLSEGLYELCERDMLAPHKAACAFWLPLWWTTAMGGEETLPPRFAELGELCRGIERDLLSSCFQGIGYIGTFMSDLNQRDARTLCKEASKSDAQNGACRQGIAIRLRQPFIITN